MDNYWIIILIVVVLSLVIGILLRMRRNNVDATSNSIDGKSEDCKANVVISNPSPISVSGSEESELSIPVEELPASTHLDKEKLFELTDRIVIARISQTIPGAAQAIASTSAQRIAAATFQDQKIYTIKIPQGSVLTEKTTKGIQYAMYKSPAKGGGYAQLKEFDLTQFQKANALQISVANVMNVASMVVGQYYMSVINSKLINMTRSIKKIEDFQEKEFQSRILSVTTLVGEISQFSSEILEDKEQRSHKLLMLEVHKKTATELLGQIDLKIAEITNKNPKPKFKEYLMIVDDFQRLVGYQDILLAVLAEMCKLTYFLSKGGISMEQSRSSFKNYLGMSSAARIRLCEWHDNQIKNFNLNLELNRKERGGFARTVRQPMIYFNDKQKFEEIPIDLVNKIRRQSKELTESDPETKDVYNESVVIVIKEGKYYFLHEPANSNIICDVS